MKKFLVFLFVVIFVSLFEACKSKTNTVEETSTEETLITVIENDTTNVSEITEEVITE
jgi:hypothetical protein